MITPEKDNQNEENENKKKTAGYVGPADRDDNNLDSGDTSSVASLDKSAFTRKPNRSNQPFGSGHEPGTV